MFVLPASTNREISSRPTRLPPGGVAGAVAGGGRFGYCATSQHELRSASGPVCGAWSNVIAISAPSR